MLIYSSARIEARCWEWISVPVLARRSGPGSAPAPLRRPRSPRTCFTAAGSSREPIRQPLGQTAGRSGRPPPNPGNGGMDGWGVHDGPAEPGSGAVRAGESPQAAARRSAMGRSAAYCWVAAARDEGGMWPSGWAVGRRRRPGIRPSAVSSARPRARCYHPPQTGQASSATLAMAARSSPRILPRERGRSGPVPPPQGLPV